jgi:DNA-binding NarL/FixJ family response regulator
MKILIVDDHAMIRGGVKALCGEAELLEAENGKTALILLKAERPQMVILDLNMPGLSGLELLRQMMDTQPSVRILVFSMHGEPVYADRALSLGARGYVSKNAAPDELRTAIQRVAAGLTYIEGEIAQQLAARTGDQRQQLNERDLEILRLLGEGRSFTEIAAVLGLGYKTVANTASMIKAKLGVTRTADLIRLAVEMSFPKQ